MGKTIKQLADALGVSKTAIRNYMDDDFRVKFTAKNNPETELLTIPRSVWQLMEDQIREKDEQLRVKDQQIADLTAAVKSQAQSINADRHTALAGTLQPMLESSNPEPSEQQKKPGFFARFRGR